MALVEALDALRRRGVLTDLDVAFARFAAHVACDGPEEVTLAACLASAGVGQGDVCVDLRQLAGRPVFRVPDGSQTDPPVAPAIERWRSILRASPLVGAPGELRPLVLDGRDRLYLYRYWQYEREIADDLLERAGAPPDAVDESLLRRGLDQIFGPPAARPSPAAATDWQRVAAVAAVLRRLCVVSGGPGTGKTTTIVRVLALLQQQALASPSPDRAAGQPALLRIALAAPTGKAAARMQEAVRAAKSRLGTVIAPQVLAGVPEVASTIHRLLGPRLESVYFRHGRGNPLPVDVLVVDEASMVDVALMAKLLRALPLEAKLVLVGDKDQLASVEAGAVLGDVCGPAPGFLEPFRVRAAALCGEEIPAQRGEEASRTGAGSSDGENAPLPSSSPSSSPSSPLASPFCDSIVLLQHSYRFGPDSGIGALARLVRAGSAEEALALLESGRLAGVVWKPIRKPDDLRRELRDCTGEGYDAYLELARGGAAPAAVFETFNRFRVLCAVRDGEFGVERVNEALARMLDDHGRIDRARDWYVGRPVMITRNDYQLRLFNGDVGIALADPDGRIRVHFEAAEGRERVFPPVRLPGHEPVFAMTIHKSQGSEFDRVVVVLPPERSRILGRELLYTGLTRARAAVEVWGTRESFLEATRKPLARSSGLREALWGP